MKELDPVEVIVEKEKYAREGIHKGMYGWICDPRSIDGSWLVNFPQMGEHADIATIAVLETDMQAVPVMHALANEYIREQWGENDPKELHFVEVTAEKEEYARQGIHKGMQGRTFYEDERYYLVLFPWSDRPESMVDGQLAIADVKTIEHIASGRNEQIRAQYQALGEDISGYLI